VRLGADLENELRDAVHGAKICGCAGNSCGAEKYACNNWVCVTPITGPSAGPSIIEKAVDE
jgi:hypothetical protein